MVAHGPAEAGAADCRDLVGPQGQVLRLQCDDCRTRSVGQPAAVALGGRWVVIEATHPLLGDPRDLASQCAFGDAGLGAVGRRGRSATVVHGIPALARRRGGTAAASRLSAGGTGAVYSSLAECIPRWHPRVRGFTDGRVLSHRRRVVNNEGRSEH
jgi:hypothetical protein